MSEHEQDQAQLSPIISTLRDETPASPKTAAVNAIQQLSLESPVKISAVTAAAVAAVDGENDCPKPVVMSRGDSESTVCQNGNSRSDQQREREEHLGSNTTTAATTSNSSQEDQVVLMANHQHRVSERNTNHVNDSFQEKQKHKHMADNKKSQENLIPKLLTNPIGGAIGWLKSQKDKARREKLKQMAEEQMHVLQEATEKDPSVNFMISDEDNFSSIHGSNGKSQTQQQQGDYDDDDHDENENDYQDHSAPYSEDDISWIPPVRWVEERPAKNNNNACPSPSREPPASPSNNVDPNKPVPLILTPEQMHDIARYVLPKGIAFCRWKRHYSLVRDGDSFLQCLRLCGTEPRTLLVVKTTHGDIFGGYADTAWDRPQQTNATFFGSAQACLFSFSIKDDDDNGSGSGNGKPPLPSDNGDKINNGTKTNVKPNTKIRVFHWTGANRYIQFTDTSEHRRMLAFGGGGRQGTFGLCVEQDFQQGSTGHCDTFDNLPLCDQENFNILDLEIWGFLTGQF